MPGGGGGTTADGGGDVGACGLGSGASGINQIKYSNNTKAVGIYTVYTNIIVI